MLLTNYMKLAGQKERLSVDLLVSPRYNKYAYLAVSEADRPACKTYAEMRMFMEKNSLISEETLKIIAGQASEIVERTGRFLAETSIVSVSQKEGHANFVTDLDVKVQEILVRELTPLIPGASFLLEESDGEPSLSDIVWIIDPIDGTQNFICRNNQSAISIGLFSRGTGLLGIVYNPFLAELFTAVKGNGAFLNGSPIRVSGKPLSDAVICAGTSPYYEELREKSLHAVSSLFPLCADFRRFGSAALEICYTACGRCDGYFEYRLSPWDYAGASVILLEAGGRIGSIGRGQIDYTKKTGIVAGGQAVYEALQNIL